MNVKLFQYEGFFELNANTYVLYDESECVVIDSGKNNNDVVDFINENHLKLKAILLTHGHFDHIQGLPALLKAFDVPVYIHKDDECMLSDSYLNGSNRFSRTDIYYDGDVKTFTDGEVFHLLKSPIEVIATPFHTKGSVCFYLKDNKMLFTGDSLFSEGIGRTDFPNAIPELEHHSLYKLTKLDKDITIYPGHGDSCSLKEAEPEAYL